MLCVNKWILFGLIPLILSVAFGILHSPILLLLCILSHFLILHFVPGFKGRERLGMFLMVAMSSFPINLSVLISLWRLGGFFLGSVFPLPILRCVLYYCVMFGIEEIFMGVLATLIWRAQKKSGI